MRQRSVRRPRADALTSSGGGTLGFALLPILALAAALTAAVCVGSLVVAWLRKPGPDRCAVATDPRRPGCSRSGSCRAARRHAGCRRPSCCSPAAASSRSGTSAPFVRARGSRPGHAARLRRGLSAGRGVDRRVGDPADEARCSPCFTRPHRRLAHLGRGVSVAVDRVVKDNEPSSRHAGRVPQAAAWYREAETGRPVHGPRRSQACVGIALGLLTLSAPATSVDGLDRVERDRHRGAVARPAPAPAALDSAERGRTAAPRAGEPPARGRREHGCRERRRGRARAPWAVLFDEASVIRRLPTSRRAARAPRRPGTGRRPVLGRPPGSCIAVVTTS